ncbi:MAG: ATP-binding protein [Candidatus Eremiobacterota bacterium]
MSAIHILYLEDKLSASGSAREVLLEEGIDFEITTVNKKNDFISAIEKNTFDIILSDYILPGSDSMEILKIVENKCPHIPFIFISVVPGEEAAVEAIKGGAADYILKNRLYRLGFALKRAMKEKQKKSGEMPWELNKIEDNFINSEEILSIIINGNPESFFLMDTKGTVIIANETMAKRLGCEADDIKGKNVYELLPAHVREKRLKMMNKALLSGEILRFEDERMGVHMYNHVNPILNREGHVKMFSILGVDITKRKHMEEVLKKSEHELDVINLIARVFLTVKDDDIYGEVLDIILKSLDSKYGLFGFINDDGDFVPSSMIGRIWDVCEVPDKHIIFYRKHWGGIWGRSLMEGKTLCSNVPLSVPEGHIPIFRAVTVPIVYKNKTTGLLALANRETDYKEEDIKFLEVIASFIAPVLNARLERNREENERKKAEDMLKESEEKYRGLVDNIGIGVALISPDMEILALNKQMKSWFPHIDVSAKPVCYKKFNNPPRENICSYCPTYRTLQDGQVYESFTETPAGEKTITYRIISSPVRDKDGTIKAAIEMVEDITERKKAERELIEHTMARDVAEASNRAKSELLSNISHELRTPLNSILGYARLLMGDEKLTENQKRGIGIIEKSGVHLLALINDILDISRIEARKMEILKYPFDLKKMLHMIERMIEVKTMEKNLLFNVEYDDDLPGYVTGDEKKISQILLNLLSNAVKFTHYGSIGLKVNKKDKNIRFQVEDTGIGIPEENLDIIFSPFQQLSGHLKKTEGSGLGLSISRELAELMGSKLNVESTCGKGSKFWFEMELVPHITADRDCHEGEISTDIDTTFKGKSPEYDNIRIPADIVKNLFHISEKGDFKAMKKELERVKSLDNSYEPFYKKVKNLIDGFELERVNKLLENYISKDIEPGDGTGS